jgi:hypothetical protein
MLERSSGLVKLFAQVHNLSNRVVELGKYDIQVT